ncbi:hypothetical protein [Malaciobacter mytili]|uniref:Uncharacterized protein n=1 Tax=Malaciobacter mytili LMG 24559 TaxID=1032238 RepID=A0AAX2AHT8_9BACT|nr:hypothetical protein [Malaciobacter mytili]AXH13854.1 hypothetical protein AMYT_0235 [Malaciobacter mytili LMG 24559]RXK15493.1 hypothetical protein CP985_08145 [Malaciobacter mytili LMG 24559]
MHKFLFFLLIFFNFSFALVIEFKEERYLYALDNSIYKKGFIEFKENSIKTWYKNSKETLYFKNDKLYKIKDKEQIELNNIAAKIYFLILEGIFHNNSNVINKFFIQEKQNDLILLAPKEIISKYMQKVEYKKKKEKLIFLKIYLHNNDRIIIEQTN